MDNGLNERHIYNRSGGEYETLKDFMDRRIALSLPYIEEMQYNLHQSWHCLVNRELTQYYINAGIISGRLAVGKNSIYGRGLICAKLQTDFDEHSKILIRDDRKIILNRVNVRSVPLLKRVTFKNHLVYGLLQCAQSVADGDYIGYSGNENIQVSFVYDLPSGLHENARINEPVQLQLPFMAKEREVPIYHSRIETY